MRTVRHIVAELNRQRKSAPETVPHANQREGFRFLDDAEIEKLPDPGWVIKGILPEQAVALIYGVPGVGKSFVALDMALSIQSGEKWLDHAVSQGDVLYILAEGSVRVKKRLKAWKNKHGVNGSVGAHFLPNAVQLTDPQQLTELLNEIKRHHRRKYKRIVVDTLAMCLAGRDESGSVDMGLLVAAVDEIRRVTGATVLLVHHPGKDPRKGSRGHSSLLGAVDTEILLRMDNGVLTLTCKKQKDAEEFEPIRMKLVKHLDSCVIAVAGPCIVGTDLPDNLLPCLQGLAGVQGKSGTTAKGWEESSGLASSTFYRHRGELVEEGYAELDGKLYRLTTKGRTAITPTPKPLP